MTVVGPSGCGKSTLLGLAAGLQTVQQGEIWLGGAVLAERMILEFDYRERREANREAKRAIAAAARRPSPAHVRGRGRAAPLPP